MAEVEKVSYDDDVFNDVKAAFAEVSENAEPAVEKTEPVKTETVEQPAKVEPEKVSARDDNRDEKGRFAPTKDKQTTESKVAEAAPSTQAQPTAPAKPDAPVAADVPATGAVKVAPPPGWSIKSKSEWDKLPQHVRDDIAKRETEVSDGFASYAGLKPFAERAKAGGQSLSQVLNSYVGMEDLLRRDMGAGLMAITQNIGLTQAEAARVFAHMAQRLGHNFTAPAQQPGGSMGDSTPPFAAQDPNSLTQVINQTIGPIVQRLNSVESMYQRQAAADQNRNLTHAENIENQFRADPANRYFANVEDDIVHLLKSGAVPRSADLAADLKAAYDKACWQNPEIRELLINERVAKIAADKATAAKQAADKARAASRSITGSPSQESDRPQKRAKGTSYEDDLQADVRAAFEANRAAV